MDVVITNAHDVHMNGMTIGEKDNGKSIGISPFVKITNFKCKTLKKMVNRVPLSMFDQTDGVSDLRENIKATKELEDTLNHGFKLWPATAIETIILLMR